MPATVVVAAARFDLLPGPVLSRILSYDTADIKQTLRVGLTCRRLYNLVRHDKAVWPAQVCVTHGCTYFHERRDRGKPSAILVSVDGQEHEQEEDARPNRRLLPVGMTRPKLTRLLSVMHLPSMCPVPVVLRLMPCSRIGWQQHFLMQYVLPWLDQHKYVDDDIDVDERDDDDDEDHSPPRRFANIHMLFDMEEFELYNPLLLSYLCCLHTTTTPVHLHMYINRDIPHILREGMLPWCRVVREQSATGQLANVHRLTLQAAVESSGLQRTGRIFYFDVPRFFRMFPCAVDIDLRDAFIGSPRPEEQWAMMWRAFVGTRAVPGTTTTLRMMAPVEPVVAHMQAGCSTDVDDGLRSHLAEHLGSEQFVALEQWAYRATSVDRVSCNTARSLTLFDGVPVNKESLTLHLLADDDRQTESTIILYGERLDDGAAPQ